MNKRRVGFWIVQSLVGIVLLLMVVAGGAFIWLRGSLPMTEGKLTVAGLEAAVEVIRDADGIVTIRAQDQRDATFALGFVHAQDRLWQMDFMRRTGAGRLSEVVGEGTLKLDQLTRTLGFYRLAQASLARLRPETRALVEAYTAGVNAFLKSDRGPWPPEFYLLRYRPEPWTPADSLVWGRLMALQLSGNWSEELRRLRLSKDLSAEQIDFLWPTYPEGGPLVLDPQAAGLENLAVRRLAEILPWTWAPKSASNSWVLANELSATGKPILANDPHLALDAPGTWYLVRLETPELTITGGTVPGVPFVVAGNNGRIAWGLTTTEGDTQDIFIERLSEGEPDSYDTPDGPMPFETRSETIEVHDKESFIFEARSTRHGPVISDLLGESPTAFGEGRVLSIAWPALMEDDRTADALYGINRARDWPSFLAALESWNSPLQTLTYADTSGRTALIAPGRVPIRRSGDGRVPVPGWNGEYDWIGFIPFDKLPRLVDPANGKIVTANNRLVPDDYPFLITADWRNPYRAQRIAELLDQGSSFTLAQNQDFQQDLLSTAARELLPLLLALEPASDEADQGAGAARDLLSQWDFRMGRDRAEPMIFYAWITALNRLLLADELGPNFGDFRRVSVPLLIRILNEGQTWCDDVGTEPTESCQDRVTASLAEALAGLRESFGSDTKSWRWGEAHVARFAHPIFSRIPVVKTLFDYSVETDGGNYTIKRGGMPFSGLMPFENIHGAGYRAVYDLADLDNSRYVIATGQSGNPLSPNYGNFAERWRDGAYVKLDGKAAEGAQTLTLEPR